MARSRSEDIEHFNRLKFGSQFNYMPEPMCTKQGSD